MIFYQGYPQPSSFCENHTHVQTFGNDYNFSKKMHEIDWFLHRSIPYSGAGYSVYRNRHMNVKDAPDYRQQEITLCWCSISSFPTGYLAYIEVPEVTKLFNEEMAKLNAHTR